MIEYASFCEKQAEYIKRCFSSWLNIAEGGKRAGKNIINLIAWASVLETHKDKLHLAAGVSISSAKLNIIDSNGFGLKYWFEGRCREGKYQERNAIYIQTAIGEKIVLISGGGKEGDEKYIKGNTYGTVYITEVNECCQTFIKEAFDRTISSADRKLFLDLNPKAPAHPFYKDVLEVHQLNNTAYSDYGLNYEHFTLFDNLSLSDEKLREVIRTYQKNSLWYKRDILGLRVQPEGAVYDMFTDAMLFDDSDCGVVWHNPTRRVISIDYGTTNPCVFLDIHEQGGVSWVMREYYYDSKEHNKQKTDDEYANDLLQFIGDTHYFCIVIDPSAASFKQTLRRKFARTKDADNEVLDGIRLVSSLFMLGKLRIHRNCTHLRQELTAYVWDTKLSDKGKEQPVKASDHALDALRYYAKTIVKGVR